MNEKRKKWVKSVKMHTKTQKGRFSRVSYKMNTLRMHKGNRKEKVYESNCCRNCRKSVP